MADEIVVAPVGVVRSRVTEPVDDVWGGLVSRIELDSSRFGADAVAGLAEFSHVEVVFVFDRVTKMEYGARHPRGRADWPKVGIFAQRGKDRPNRLGITVCKLRSVKGLAIEVEGLDAIDGSPVVDVKPYMREFGPRGEVRQPKWASELMAGYWEEE